MGDISFRALEILKSVDFIACEDTRQSIKLLNHFDIKNHLVAYHKFNENEKSNSLIDSLLEGKNIAIIADAGTPCISDPGYILIKKCHEFNIPVIAIPGASAVISSLSISGIDTSSFAFIGFLPIDNTKYKEKIKEMKENPIKTFVIYESPKRLVKLFAKLVNEFPISTVYIASDLTKVHERGFYGSIEEVYNTIKNDPNIEKGEYAIVLQKSDNITAIEDEKEEVIEALIVETMIKNDCSMKEAVNILSNLDNKYRKKDIYNASLHLKDMFSN